MPLISRVHISDPLISWVIYAVAGIFLIGAIVNFVGPASIRQEYAQWGYHPSFRFVTAALEGAAFVLIMNSSTRSIGLVLSALIMLGAIGTLFRAHQFAQSIPAAVVLVLSVLLIG